MARLWEYSCTCSFYKKLYTKSLYTDFCVAIAMSQLHYQQYPNVLAFNSAGHTSEFGSSDCCRITECLIG